MGSHASRTKKIRMHREEKHREANGWKEITLEVWRRIKTGARKKKA